MTPIIVQGRLLGYSISFTGRDAEMSLVGDRVTQYPILPVEPTQQAKREPRHGVYGGPKGGVRPPCVQCGRPTSLHTGKLCGRCKYEGDLEAGRKTDRKLDGLECVQGHKVRRQWCEACKELKRRAA